jgi:RHS repeat-associated protein
VLAAVAGSGLAVVSPSAVSRVAHPASGPSAVTPVRLVSPTATRAAPPAEDLTTKAAVHAPATATFPAPGDASTLAPAFGVSRAGSSMVSVGEVVAGSGTHASAPVRVRVLDRTAVAARGGQFAGFEVKAPAGSRSARVALDVAGFANAVGGGYADRLALYAVPACVTGAPGAGGCPLVPLTTTRTSRTVLTARVPLAAAGSATAAGTAAGAVAATAGAVAAVPGAATGDASVTVLALSGASGAAGNYAASPLQASQAWSVGLGSGSFSYQYPVATPTPPGGPAPGVSLDYDSGSVDGRTGADNGQVSEVGQGWELRSAYIERQYAGCSTDGAPSTWGDLCWTPDVRYVLSLNGQSHDLIPVSGSTTPWSVSEFRLRDDANWLVRRYTGQSNGDNDGEYFSVTTPDGYDYWFGYGVSPWATSAATDSVWTVPVYGNNSGEPCYVAGNATGSSCTQGWRWNLDRAVDRRGNVISYTYDTEINAYARAFGTVSAVNYVRGGHLLRIEYGGKVSGTAAERTFTSRVEFKTIRRCLQEIDYPASGTGSCPTLSLANATSFPDVPTDLLCTVGATSCNASTQSSPTFFSSYRLYRILTANVLNGAAGYVDQYDLRAQLPDPDGTGPDSPELWLSRIKHLGIGSPSIATGSIDFNSSLEDNRVDYLPPYTALPKYRVAVVTNELGGTLTVRYNHTPGRACDPNNVPTVNTNLMECFPRWWKPAGASASVVTWFHKWVVDNAIVTDPVTSTTYNPPTGTKLSSEPQVYIYEYVGGAAWHHDDNVLVPADHRSWSEWRGYQNVVVHRRRVVDGVVTSVGGTTDRSQTRYTYFRGMDHDKADPTGTPRSVLVDTVETTPETDYPYLRGVLTERQDLDGDGTVLSRQWFGKWALKTVDLPETTGTGYITTRDAYMVRVDQERTRTATSSGLLKTLVDYTIQATPGLPSTGMVTQTDDRGDEAVTTDSRCTSNELGYNAASSTWLAVTARERTWFGACSTGTLLTRTDRFHDGATAVTVGASAALTRGEQTRTDAYTSSTAKITTTATYGDTYGRVTQATDGRGNATTTAFIPAVGRTTSVTVTGPPPSGTGSGFATTTALEAQRGLPVSVTDANGALTTLTYDGLGRLKTVRGPGQQAGGRDTLAFTYTTPVDAITNLASAVSSVRTSTLQVDAATPTYVDSYTHVDGWGRTIQTRTVSPASTGPAPKSVVVTTRYNDRGLAQGASGPTLVAAAASAAWADVDRDTLATDTRTSYDALGRQVAQALFATGTEQWRTSTSWDGLDSTVQPPTGGKTQYLTDARGRTTTVREYDTAATPALYATTSLGYTERNELASVTSPLGKVSSYTYDLLGRRTGSTDPDTGGSSSVYDGNGNVLTTTDARGVQVSTTYDTLNRPVSRYTGAWTASPPAANLLATWTYDTLTGAYGKGRLTSQTAKITPPGGSTVASYTQSVSGYTADGRPTGATWAIPAGFGIPSAQTYTESYGYDAAGHGTTNGLPAAGGLPAETVTATWTGVGLPASLASSVGGTLVASTGFDGLARLTGRQWASASGPSRAYTYDPRNRISTVQTTVAGTLRQDDAYAYTKTDLMSVTDRVVKQAQCYSYDPVRRLSRAWTLDTTAGAICNAATPNPSHTYSPAGAPAYDQAWTFDTDNTLTRADDLVSGSNVTFSGQYTAGKPAHAPTTAAGPGTLSNALAYDPSGYLTSRTPNTGAPDTLVWDSLHQLKSSTDAGVTTNFGYGADGSRLLRQTPTETTLSVGGTDLVFPAGGGTVTGRRYYTLAGSRVAVRTSSGGSTSLAWLAADPQASTDLSIDAGTGTMTRTRYTPYGSVRTSPGAFGTGLPTTDKGWLGQTLDKTTGLNHLGARYFDAPWAQFTAPDPLFSPTNPRTINPYTYAWGNPIAHTDANGLCVSHVIDDGAICVDTGRPANPGATPAPRGGSDSNGCGPGTPGCYPAPRGGASGSGAGGGAGGGAAPVKPRAWTDQERWQRDAAEMICSTGCGRQYIPGCSGPTGTPEGCDAYYAYSSAVGKAFVEGVTGYTDLMKCTHGSASGCAWTVAGLFIFTRSIKAGKTVGEAAKAASAADEAAGLARAGEACLRNSFTGDTVVLMADGTAKPIWDVKFGDMVMATDPKTGETGPRKVIDLIRHSGHHTMVAVRFADGSTIDATDHHPFWVADTSTWVDAVDLVSGNRIQTANGRQVTVVGLDVRERNLTAYNLSIADLHTYFAGDDAVLVHNAGCDEWAAAFANSPEEIKSFRSPYPALGEYRPAGPGTPAVEESWGHHTVVVRDGTVFDQWHTGGVSIEEFKQMWDYAALIDFGF